MLKAIANWLGDASGEVEIPPPRTGDLIQAASTALASPIKIKDIPEDRPDFRREYTATIMRGIRVKVTVRNGYGETYASGELTQPGGKYILFDPDHIADKIIDPVLLPDVGMVVNDMRQIDKAWRRAKPSFFIDEGGTKWIRDQG